MKIWVGKRTNKDRVIMPEEISDQLSESLDTTIAQGNNIRFILDSLYPRSENQLESLIKAVLSHYRQEDMLTTVYTCVKELVVNGMKANAKRIFFHEQGFDLYKVDEYDQGMEGFKKLVQQGQLEDYIVKARENGLRVEVDFEYNDKHLFVKVINNVALTDAEKERIQQKLEKAMEYDDIAQFYMESAGSASEEGSGMGLTMIILMLKGQNVSISNFRISMQEDEKTVATLDFPWS